MLATVGIVIAVLFVLFVAFGVFLKRVHDKRADRAAFEAETVRRASAVAAAEANKAKADQAVRDALANPLIGDATRH
ncbi:hypothetical protein [Cupriavidus malaysiensis]|uniref:Uncharacterized protein n=1 Tax=Cupriavidus malaysiensis TaxID=367825 RepID=A0ABM6F378_9BURK|nr:hypothetical protein [Cupriavidus malaysiensis]AOZ05880.1 hypothetical protein BKK80_08650 [Cupriavidus malaysiensis]